LAKPFLPNRANVPRNQVEWGCAHDRRSRSLVRSVLTILRQSTSMMFLNRLVRHRRQDRWEFSKHLKRFPRAVWRLLVFAASQIYASRPLLGLDTYTFDCHRGGEAFKVVVDRESLDRYDERVNAGQPLTYRTPRLSLLVLPRVRIALEKEGLPPDK
jgi:hypothetical protein